MLGVAHFVGAGVAVIAFGVDRALAASHVIHAISGFRFRVAGVNGTFDAVLAIFRGPGHASASGAKVVQGAGTLVAARVVVIDGNTGAVAVALIVRAQVAVVLTVGPSGVIAAIRRFVASVGAFAAGRAGIARMLAETRAALVGTVAELAVIASQGIIAVKTGAGIRIAAVVGTRILVVAFRVALAIAVVGVK